VAALRCGLDQASWEDEASRCRSLTQSSWTGVEPLPFNLGRAHDLYKALFGNIEDLIKDKQLLIVPSGPLTRLPFQVLVTAKPTADLPQKPAGYAEAAWLIKEHAVSILPSSVSLKALRQFAKSSSASKPYLGFGNPLLLGRSGEDRSA